MLQSKRAQLIAPLLLAAALFSWSQKANAGTYTRTPSGATPASPITLDFSAPAYSGSKYIKFYLYNQGSTVLASTTCTLSNGTDYSQNVTLSDGTQVYGVVLKYFNASDCSGSAADWNSDLEGTSNAQLNSTSFSGSSLQFTITAAGGGGGGGGSSAPTTTRPSFIGLPLLTASGTAVTVDASTTRYNIDYIISSSTQAMFDIATSHLQQNMFYGILLVVIVFFTLNQFVKK